MRLALSTVLMLCGASSFAVGCADEAGAPPVAPQEIVKPADSSPAPNVEPAPTTFPTSCRFIIPKSVEGTAVSCFDLVVPEDRRHPEVGSIKLHVAVVKGKAGGTPTIELIGGPGGSAESLVGPVVAKAPDLEPTYGKFLEKGDLVFFDQRGVGRSLPRLSCPRELEKSECAKSLKSKTANLAAYDTAENADDVHDLKRALGAEKIDLHGISYGTRLAIEIIKRHPNDVRGTIIDGVMPPDVQVVGGFEAAMDGVMKKIFTQCAADAKCNAAYPNLDKALDDVKAKLEATPFDVKDPLDGYKFKYDWFAFSGELFGGSYMDGSAGAMPMFIYDALKMNAEEWQKRMDASSSDGPPPGPADAQSPLLKELDAAMAKMTAEDEEVAFGESDGMYLSVTCNDYVQHEKREVALQAMTQIRPALRDQEMIDMAFDECKGWPVRESDPNLRAPSTFAGPVMVIGGEVDVATPVEWAVKAASTLPQKQLIEVKAGAHGYMDACAGQIKNAFFADPTKQADTACMAGRAMKFAYHEPATTPAFRSRTNKAVLRDSSLVASASRMNAFLTKLNQTAKSPIDRAIDRANLAVHIATRPALFKR